MTPSKNPDGRLRFPEAKTLSLPLPGEGSLDERWVPFQISGEKQSVKIGDAKISVRENDENGAIVGGAEVTVFYFDPADITVGRGAQYTFHDNTYDTKGKPAVNFSASAVIKPEKLDCQASQLKDLHIGILQNVISAKITRTYTNPQIVLWAPGVPPNTRIEVPLFVDVITEVTGPLCDSDDSDLPLVDMSAKAFKPPVGCPNGEEARATDTPSAMSNYPPNQGPSETSFGDQGAINAIYRYTTLSGIRLEHEFRVWCVTYDDSDVFNTVTVPLREAKWSLHADSTKANQHATVPGADHDPDHDPVVQAPFANDAINTTPVTETQMATPTVYFFAP